MLSPLLTTRRLRKSRLFSTPIPHAQSKAANTKAKAAPAAAAKQDKKKLTKDEKKARDAKFIADRGFLTYTPYPKAPKNMYHFVKWPLYIRTQRQRAILKQRIRVPAAINQFSKTLKKDQGMYSRLVEAAPDYLSQDHALPQEPSIIVCPALITGLHGRTAASQ